MSIYEQNTGTANGFADYHAMICSALDLEKNQLWGYAIKIYKKILSYNPNDHYALSHLKYCKRIYYKQKSIVFAVAAIVFFSVCAIIIFI